MHVEVSGPSTIDNETLAFEIAALVESRGRRVLVRDHDSPTAYADREFDVVVTCKRTER